MKAWELISLLDDIGSKNGPDGDQAVVYIYDGDAEIYMPVTGAVFGDGLIHLQSDDIS